MSALLKMVCNSVLAVCRLVFLPLAALRSHKQLGTALRWTIHAVAVTAIVVALGLLNHLFGVDRLVRAPITALRRVWLPLMFLQLYVLSWLGWWLARLLNDRAAPSPFPDLDAAWSAALEALSAGGIHLHETPIYLVLGETTSSTRNFFGASRQPLLVRQAPDPAAPLTVSANADGIYLTCAGASLLGDFDCGPGPAATARIGDLWAAESPADAESPVETDEGLLPLWNPAAPVVPDVSNWKPGATEAGAAVALLDPEPVQPQSAARAAQVQPAPQVGKSPMGKPASDRAIQRKSAEEIALATARLRYLCNLLLASRRPYCPINGVLALVPLAGCENEVIANQVGALLERDLDVVHDTLEVECPLFVMVCDLEQAPGCRELLRRFPDEQRHRRLGIKLPPVPAADVERLPSMIEEAIGWICSRLVPTLVFRLLQVDRGGHDRDEQEASENRRLYGFLYEMRRRSPLLARAISRCVRGNSSRHWQFGGCFLGATGSDPQFEQAFVAGVFPLLRQLQDCVSWTPQALAADARARLAARLGYGGVGLASIALLICLLYAF